MYSTPANEDTTQMPSEEAIKNYESIIVDRKRHDTLCCCLFFIFVIVFFGIGLQAMFTNKMSTLTAPIDEFGNYCGEAKYNLVNETANRFDCTSRSYLFYYDVTSSIGKSRCVTTCPDAVGISSSGDSDYIGYSGIDTDPYVTYPSLPVFGRCFPDVSQLAVNLSNANSTASKVVAFFADSFSTRFMAELSEGKLKLGICLVIGLVVGLIWIWLLRCMAGFLTYLTIFAVIALFLYATYYTYSSWKDLEEEYKETNNADTKDDANNMKWVFYITAGVTVIFLLIMLFLWSRIKLAVAVIKVTSRAVSDMRQLLLVPVVFFVIDILFISIWFYITLMLMAQEDALTYKDGRRIWNYSTKQYGILLFDVFALFWILCFFSALSQITTAGAVAEWYFYPSEDKSGMSSPVWGSFMRAWHYNLGSVAFGALLVAILMLIRFILRIIEEQLKKKKQQTAANVVKCVNCCLKCVQKIIKYINKNAYIYIAIYGGSFINGCKEAVQLIVANVARAATLDFVADFLLVIGKVFISAITAAIAAFMFKTDVDYTYKYWFILAGVVFVGTFAIASLILAVFDMAVDTIFLCFLVDSSEADDEEDRLRAPKELQSFYKLNKKKSKKKDKEEEE
ncbi:hypothetical protein PCE1_004120 [Barthelona sp. PCE]